MSLDKRIHSHLDKMDSIEEQVLSDIDDIIKSIDIDQLIESPSKVLGEAVELIREVMIEKYIPLATEAGEDLSDKIGQLEKKGVDIIVDPSKDPNENKDLVNDNGNGKN